MRNRLLVVEAVEKVALELPFPMLGVDWLTATVLAAVLFALTAAWLWRKPDHACLPVAVPLQ